MKELAFLVCRPCDQILSNKSHKLAMRVFSSTPLTEASLWPSSTASWPIFSTNIFLVWKISQVFFHMWLVMRRGSILIFNRAEINKTLFSDVIVFLVENLGVLEIRLPVTKVSSKLADRQRAQMASCTDLSFTLLEQGFHKFPVGLSDASSWHCRDLRLWHSLVLL